MSTVGSGCRFRVAIGGCGYVQSVSAHAVRWRPDAGRRARRDRRRAGGRPIARRQWRQSDPIARLWTNRTDNLPSLSTGALVVAPSNDMIVYDGTGEGALSGDSYFGNGILKSVDGGFTWSHVSGDFFAGVSISRLAIDPNDSNHLYAAVLRGRGGARRVSPPIHSTYGLWESKDGAVTWTLLKPAPTGSLGATDIRLDPQQPKNLYASFWSNAIYKSTNGG